MTLCKKTVSVVQRAVIKVKKEDLNVYHVQMERGPSATTLGTLLLAKVQISLTYLCLLLQKQFFVVKFASPISSPLILIMIPFPRKDRLSFFVTIVSTRSFSSLTERK